MIIDTAFRAAPIRKAKAGRLIAYGDTVSIENELAVAGGLAGRPLEVVRAATQDLLVPAHDEIVLEGEVLAGEEGEEGPFGEFVGFAAPAAPCPVFKITALTRRKHPIYHAINGYERETVMARIREQITDPVAPLGPLERSNRIIWEENHKSGRQDGPV